MPKLDAWEIRRMHGVRQKVYKSDDCIDDETWFNTPRFAQYTVSVLKAIKTGGEHGLMVGEIHRQLGDNAIRRMTMDALGMLVSAGEVVESFKLPTRYIAVGAKRESKRVDYVGNFTA